MSKWQKDGDWFINETAGNILKTEDSYLVFVPKIIKLGPFPTLEAAQAALEIQSEKISQMIEELNLQITKV